MAHLARILEDLDVARLLFVSIPSTYSCLYFGFVLTLKFSPSSLSMAPSTTASTISNPLRTDLPCDLPAEVTEIVFAWGNDSQSYRAILDIGGIS